MSDTQDTNSNNILLIARFNARLKPMDRGDIFQDPLHEALEELGLGTVTGGGAMGAMGGEIEFCDVEVVLFKDDDETVQKVIEILEGLGAPVGSELLWNDSDRSIPFGKYEGLGLYLNGTDLPAKTYEMGDPNFVWSELDRLLGDEGRVYSYWEGPKSTALYLYGPSFETMKSRIADFIATYPLCEKCEIKQIA